MLKRRTLLHHSTSEPPLPSAGCFSTIGRSESKVTSQTLAYHIANKYVAVQSPFLQRSFHCRCQVAFSGTG